MKSLFTVLKSVVLSLLLVASALAADKVNINTADAATLESVLVGIGQSKAEAIVEYRKTHGPFKSAEELAMVKGIGLKTVEKNRDRIELHATAAAPARPTQARQQPPVTRR
ncbi:MAG TPA: ComEA family DNA-binding protein [Pseudoxanthomonas sp.]|jgi:competence protein ComEA|nr:ComEA family DNA-binding protein [Pseudoxanthomonas sp.]